jgi:hypothetical protein
LFGIKRKVKGMGRMAVEGEENWDGGFEDVWGELMMKHP